MFRCLVLRKEQKSAQAMGSESDPGGVLESRRCGIIRQLAKSEIEGILMSLFGSLFRISPGEGRKQIVIFILKMNGTNKFKNCDAQKKKIDR